MKLSLIVLLTFVFATGFAQENVQSKLNKTLSFRGLSEKDITIPITTDKDKSPTNQSKLLLPYVNNLMQHPMLYAFNDLSNMKLINKFGVFSTFYKFLSNVYGYNKFILIDEFSVPYDSE